MVEIKFDACFLIIRFGEFSLDFTERVTYIYQALVLLLQTFGLHFLQDM